MEIIINNGSFLINALLFIEYTSSGDNTKLRTNAFSYIVINCEYLCRPFYIHKTTVKLKDIQTSTSEKH